MKYFNLLRSLIYIVVGVLLAFVIMPPLKVSPLAHNLFASFCVIYGGFRFYQSLKAFKENIDE
jgi:hypothetical protein